MLPVFFSLGKSPYGFPSSMVPLRFMCDIALCLLVFLCIIGRSLQGCADYLDNSTKFLKANFSPHQYIRLEGLSLNPARGTMNRTEVANCTTHQWCTQSGNISSHQCNIYQSCFNESMNLAQTGCDSSHELYPQKMEMVSMLQLYCMVNIVQNKTDFPSECKEGEKIYVCTLKPTEKTPTPSFHDKTTTEAATTEAATTEAATTEAATTEAATTEAATTEAATTEAATTTAATTKAATTCGSKSESNATFGDNQGFIASNVVLVFLLVLLIVSNATWCQYSRRQRRIHQLWRAGHQCACPDQTDQLLTEIPDQESRP
ncbi:uncharacterized protein LOC132453036 [Gadus macrocephalus]|uniref:uncharacterized protein LOC132453036 n=1 Tax=Gadus macrocephalus TaxID=80720 RepID=UPI0028CB2D44|nr:uncharacterized protein LOC132453036 [Gadus macrocephalus]